MGKATLVASLLRLEACAKTTDISEEVRQDITNHSKKAMEVCVRIAACASLNEEVVIMLLRAMGEVTRAQVMTGQAFEDSFHRSFHVYMDCSKPVLDVVLEQQASSDEAETPLSSAWNFLYRQLTIIAMFKKEA